MWLFLRVLLAAALVWEAHGAGASDVPIVRVGGNDYMALRAWAAAGGWSFIWNRELEEARLSGRAGTMVFKVSSRRMELNEIGVFLSFPIVLHRSEPHIAVQDLGDTLRPIMNPSPARAGERVRTVAICAGHGGRDGGNQVGTDQEKKYTLLLLREVERLLSKSGVKTVAVRTRDVFVDLEERALIARRRGADLFLSLHYNSAGRQNPEVNGGEVYCLTPAGAPSTNGGSALDRRPEPGNANNDRNVLLAYHIQRAMVRNLGVQDRGVRRARFVVLRRAEMPAALVEGGFMTNREELRRIKDSGYRRRMAQAIVDGVLAYKRAVER